MRIGVIGAGYMADTLGTQWARAGHELLIAGRTPDKARALAERIGGQARAGTIAEAAAFADTVLFAIRREGVFDTLDAAGAGDDALRGKTLVDCTNPIAEAEGFRPVTADGPSIARQIADRTGANVVKAFNLCPFMVYAMTPPVFDGVPLGVPYCGDDPEARAVVGQLVRDIGATPIDVGGLDRAGCLEGTGAIVINVVVAGGDPRTIIPPMPKDGPAPGEEPATAGTTA